MSRWDHQTFSKKIPANPKFAGVKPVVSTGLTMKRVEVMADNQISRRRQETFGRMNSAGLAQLMAKEREGETVFDLFEENLVGQWTQQAKPID